MGEGWEDGAVPWWLGCCILGSQGLLGCLWLFVLMLLLSAVSLAGCPFGWQESGPIAGREKAELQWTHVKAPTVVVADSGSDSHVDRWQWWCLALSFPLPHPARPWMIQKRCGVCFWGVSRRALLEDPQPAEHLTASSSQKLNRRTRRSLAGWGGNK